MIATLSGTIKTINEGLLTVEQAGIGFEVFTPASNHFEINQQVFLQVHLHWNQDSGPTLYGFNSLLEKTI